jgi:hypothetical protein
VRYNGRMNTKALIKEIAELTPEERLEVSDFLLIESSEADEKAREERLKQEIQKGIDSIERGEGIEINSSEELKEFIQQCGEEARRELEAEGVKIAP